jgi:hypothetical protein
MSVTAQLQFTDATGRPSTVKVRVITKAGDVRLVELQAALIKGDCLAVAESALKIEEPVQ